ncbi:MAG: 16S rRNA (cytosine(967)-C(5))-methyltransferase RsmB [Eubacterium sp.]
MTEKVNTRDLVVDILLAVTRDGEFSHIAIRNVLDKYRYLPKQDRAFITRVSQGTLERMTEIDYIINQFSKTKVNKMKPVIRSIIRSGVYQLKYMDAVPDSAACNEAVKLAGKRGFSGLKGFVNGVLRNISRNLNRVEYPDEQKNPAEALSVRYSMPQWLVERFLKQYGQERCIHILDAFLREKSTSIRVNTESISVEELQASLERQGIWVKKNSMLPYALFITGYEALDEIPEFEEGLFYVQDTASMMVAETASPKPGDFVLDVCAAPGGKSVHMAQLLAGTGMVEARDLTEYKAEMIRENAERCRISNLRVKVWDALIFDESMEQQADVVIADLPCSGLGVIGTKTDIKYKISEEKIHSLCELQSRILDVVHRYVKPQGILMYSTCTMTPEENDIQVSQFLLRHPEYTLLSQRQLLPDEGCDGFLLQNYKKVKQEKNDGKDRD